MTLNERRPAGNPLRAELFDKPLERQILAGKCAEGRLAHAMEEVGEESGRPRGPHAARGYSQRIL
jgi:hypothetical protein